MGNVKTSALIIESYRSLGMANNKVESETFAAANNNNNNNILIF
jgi:hypothetical protein